MATEVLLNSQLRLIFDMGLDEDGEQVYKRKNYNNIKTSATVESLLQVAEAIGSLQTETLAFVERSDINQIIE